MTTRATYAVPGYPTRGWRLHVPMAPDDPAGPGPAVAPAPAPSPEPKPAEPKAAAAPKAAAEPKPAKPTFKVAATNALGEKITGLGAEVARLNGELKGRDLDAAFSAAKIDPAYREFARSKIGDVDPKTDAGKKAIDDFARAHTAMLTPEAKPADPVSAWIDQTLAKDTKRQSLASMMPRAELERTLANLVK